MLFSPPYQFNEKEQLAFEGGERYLGYLNPDPTGIGSLHDEYGRINLSTHPGFLKPIDSLEQLFEVSAVHELFHAVQAGNPAYFQFVYGKNSQQPGSPECERDVVANHWLTEGSASAVQIQYLERQNKYVYGHPFKGSPRVSWVRYFDQPLDWGGLPPQYRIRDITPIWRDRQSWSCSYGTWYFWYAVGNMLGSKDPDDSRRTAYLRHIFGQHGPWEGTGLAMVDAGLKQAAKAFEAIAPYQGGLFALYPQFVAQYLNVDDFYENVENVVMVAPSLYETSQQLTDISMLEPIASRAWRFRVQLPSNATLVPHIVRFVLESPNQSSLEGLHLIVDRKVIERPVDPSVPYSHTRSTGIDSPNEQGEWEYFVRVANVAKDAATTLPAEFILRAEVEGYYGEGSQGHQAPPPLPNVLRGQVEQATSHR